MAATLLILLAIGVGVGAIYFFPEETARWYQRFSQTSSLVWGVIALIVAVVFIGSGHPVLVVIGALGIIVGVWWIAIEEPHETVRDVVR